MLARQVLYHLSHFISSFFVLGTFEIGSWKLASNLYSPDLCLRSSWTAKSTGISHWPQQCFYF
jgi:hypothetical protein